MFPNNLLKLSNKFTTTVTFGQQGIDPLQTEFVQDNSVTEPMYQTTFYLHQQIKGTTGIV